MLNRVKLEDVPEGYRDLVDVIGLEAFKNLVRYMGVVCFMFLLRGRLL